LSATQATYLAAVAAGRGCIGLAYVDVSTGEFACAQLDGADCEEVARAELSRICPAECLGAEEELVGPLLPVGSSTTIDSALFSLGGASQILCAHFNVPTVEALGLAESPLAAQAAGAILRYVQRTQPRSGAVVERI